LNTELIKLEVAGLILQQGGRHIELDQRSV